MEEMWARSCVEGYRMPTQLVFNVFHPKINIPSIVLDAEWVEVNVYDQP